MTATPVRHAVLTGIRTVKLPVADLPRAREWYQRVFGWTAVIEFPDADGVVRGAGGHLAGCPDVGLSLRENPAAHTVAGLELMLGVADRDALVAWGARLDELGVAHSPVLEASLGWLMVLHDADGHELHLYTDSRHGADVSDRPGHGRQVT